MSEDEFDWEIVTMSCPDCEEEYSVSENCENCPVCGSSEIAY